MKSLLYVTQLAVTFVGISESNIFTGPSVTVAPVCRVGYPLQTICTASVQFIRWNILQNNEQGTLVAVGTSVQINSIDDNQMSQRVVNSATFTFTRTSGLGDLPLISTVSIDSVSIGLNGTVVKCTDSGNEMTLASSIIQIIDTSQSEFAILIKFYILHFVVYSYLHVQ